MSLRYTKELEGLIVYHGYVIDADYYFHDDLTYDLTNDQYLFCNEMNGVVACRV